MGCLAIILFVFILAVLGFFGEGVAENAFRLLGN